MKQRDRLSYLARAPRTLVELALRGRYRLDYDLMPIDLRDMTLTRRANLVRGGLNLLHRRSRPLSWPLFMHLELTNYCNLRCPVCPTGSGQLQRPRAALDPDLCAALLAEVGSRLLLLNLFSWGEPLLHPQLGEILRLAQTTGAITVVATNGQNLNDPAVQEALLRHPPSYLIVAIDGTSDGVNRVYRVGARLRPALDGVRLLAEARRERGAARPILHMRFIAMEHNQAELPHLRSFARDHHFDSLSVRALLLNGLERPFRELLPEEEAHRIYTYDGRGRVPGRDYLCEHAFVTGTVMADGTVVLCDQDFNGRFPLGRFDRSHTFKSIWFSARGVELRRKVKRRRDRLATCATCSYADRQTATSNVEYVDLHPPRAGGSGTVVAAQRPELL